jgi:outer membrane protein W
VIIRTVKYSFALSLPREIAAGQLLPSPSLNPVRSALPGSFQIEFRATSAPPPRCAIPLKARENEPLEFSVRIMIPLVVTATFFTDNVATELMIPGSSAIREVI